MKIRPILAKLMLVLVTAAALLHQPDAAASHFRYANLSWVPTTNPGEVEFQLIASFRRSRFPGQGTAGDLLPQLGDLFNDGHTRFEFGDATSTAVLLFRCTAFSITEDWIVGEVLDPATATAKLGHTYAGAGPFEAGIDDCCRVEATALNNRANGFYRALTSVTPLSGNRSPVSTLVPIINVPVGPAVTFTIPATDPDGDRIRFRLATDAEAGGCCAPPNLAIDPDTGIMTWNDMGLDTTRFWTVQVIVEDLDGAGAVKSGIPVDFLLKITPLVNTPPTCVITPLGPFTVTAGTPIIFSVCGMDANPTDQITINSGGLPGGATMTPSLPVSGGASGVCSTFNWTPGGSQGGSFPLIFSVTDQAGNQTRCEVSITVQPISDVAISKTASPAALSVGGAITYTMVVNNSGPSQASGVVVTDTLPAGVNFVSVTTSHGSCSAAGSVVTCTLGALASGGGATVAIIATAATQGTKVNTASVSSGSLDPNAANNSASASVTVIDPPVITCPGDMSLSNEPGQCYATAAFTVTATGTPLPVVVCTLGGNIITSPWQFPVGNNIVNCTAVNTSGTASCSFTVTVIDSQAPMFCPPSQAGLVHWWKGENNYQDSVGSLHGTPDGAVGFSSGKVGGSFDIGANYGVVTLGGAALPAPWTAGMWVNRRDTIGAAAAMLDDGVASLRLQQYGSLLYVGFTRYFVADYVFNFQAPVGEWVHLTYVNDGSGVSLYVNGTYIGTINDPIDLPLHQFGDRTSATSDQLNGRLDEITVFNRALGEAEVRSLYCPPDLAVNNDPGLCSAVVNYANPAASDNCGAATVVCTPPAGSAFPVGTTTVNCTATDASGNSTATFFNVTVTDREAPQVVCPVELLPYRSGDYRYAVPAPNQAIRAGFEHASYDDSSWDTGTAGFGSGGLCPLDATVQTPWPVDTTLIVRRTVQVPAGATALRVGVAIDNDVAAVYFNGTQIAGNFSHEFCATYDSLVVPVPQNLVQAGPNLLVLVLVDRGGESFFDAQVTGYVPCGLADITVGNDAGLCAAAVTYPAVELADNCDGSTFTFFNCTPLSGSTFLVGTSAVTCVASDGKGNSSTYHFNVIVNDTERPALTCGDIVAGNDPGQCSAVVRTYDVRASDNCGNVTVVCTPAAGSTFAKGTNTVTCTATDTAGNLTRCSFTVTVEDREPPVITCPADIVAVDATCDGEVVTWSLLATDNCGVTRGCNPMRGSIFPPGTTTVRCTATDAAGHSVQCSFTVKVLCVPSAKIVATPLFFCPPIMTRPAMISCNGSNSALTLDGSLSSDPETPNSGLFFQWFDEPAVFPFEMGEIVSNAVFALGPHTIKLVVTDPDGLSDTDELTVDNITVCEAIDVVMDDINSSALPRKEKRPLLSALKSACTSFSRGKCNSGRKKLDAFLKKVDQHIAPRHSSGSHDQGGTSSHPGYPVEAARFKACVQAIIDAIEAADRLQMCACQQGSQHHDTSDRPTHEHTTGTHDHSH